MDGLSHSPFLTTRNVGCSYTRRGAAIEVLRGFSLAIRPGETIHIVGPSGSGKTTFLHIAAGLQAPDEGEVVIGTRDMYTLSERERARIRASIVGILFQRLHFVPEFDLRTNVALPGLLAGRHRRKTLHLADALLERFGVAHRARHRPHEISGGEGHRAALARALLMSPKLVIADEPFTEIDPGNASVVAQALSDAGEYGAAVLIASHAPVPSELQCRVVVLAASALS